MIYTHPFNASYRFQVPDKFGKSQSHQKKSYCQDFSWDQR